MTAPVHRPSVPIAVGVNRGRIGVLEAVRPWGPFVFLEAHTNQTIPSSTSFSTGIATYVHFDSVVVRSPDSDDMVDLGVHDERITITRPGIYIVAGNVGWEKSAFSDPRFAGPSSTPGPASAGTGGSGRMFGDSVNDLTQGEVSIVAYSVGYVLRCIAVQTSGSPQDIVGGTLGLQWIAPFGGY